MKIDKPFCVIGLCARSSHRTWMPTVGEAIGHAITLLKKGSNKTEDLYVVQVIKVVRTPVNYEVVDVDLPSDVSNRTRR